MVIRSHGENQKYQPLIFADDRRSLNLQKTLLYFLRDSCLHAEMIPEKKPALMIKNHKQCRIAKAHIRKFEETLALLCALSALCGGLLLAGSVVVFSFPR